MREIWVARAIILNDRNQVLLGERAEGAGVGLMELPGGKVDPGEKPHVTVVRETKEETNLDFTSHGFYRDRVDGRFRTFYYYGSATGELHLNHEVRSARFYGEEEIVFDMAFKQKDVLSNFFEWQRKNKA
jgi:8-oxo-dGTP pyrophosphatase MutT (NUDIX family)